VVKDLLTALSHIRTPPVMGLSVSYDDLANAMSGVPANLLGAPMDMAYMMTMQGNYPEMANMVQGRSQRPELREFPMSSDWLGESVGADVDSLPFILSSLVSPDGTDVAIPAAKLAASGRMDDLIQAMTVFHGTPHKWANDRPDMSKIGTGEGAQAYGHGLYFAESPDVAGMYQRNLAYAKHGDGEFISPSGERLGTTDAANEIGYDLSYDFVNDDLRIETGAEYAYQAMSSLDDGLSKVDALRVAGDNAAKRAAVEKVYDSYEFIPPNKGNLYELDLPDETIDKMLDWDKPLSEQPESVRKAVDDIFPQRWFIKDEYLSSLKTKEGRTLATSMINAEEGVLSDINLWARLDKLEPGIDHNAIHDIRDWSPSPGVVPPLSEMTGGTFYRLLSNDGFSEKSQRRATDQLNSLGIPGIKYLDGTSRSAGEGTRNFVVFDESLVTPLKRNGEALGGTKFPDTVSATHGEPVKRVNEARSSRPQNPIKVYHSTDSDFTEFDPSRGIGGQLWFTSSKEKAVAGYDGAQSGRFIEAEVDIRNPAGWDEYEKYGIDELLAKGYDGVALPEADGEVVYVALFPEQVRVISNNPASP